MDMELDERVKYLLWDVCDDELARRPGILQDRAEIMQATEKFKEVCGGPKSKAWHAYLDLDSASGTKWVNDINYLIANLPKIREKLRQLLS